MVPMGRTAVGGSGKKPQVSAEQSTARTGLFRSDTKNWSAPPAEKTAFKNNEDGWLLQKRRRKNLLRPVILELPSGEKNFLSADNAEDLKVVIWSKPVPAARVIHSLIAGKLSVDFQQSILKIRKYGVNAHSRIELFCESAASRDALVAELRSNPLGLGSESVQPGRRSEVRFASQTRSEGLGSGGSSQPVNRFAPLGAIGPSGEMLFRIGTLNVNGLSPLLAPLWQQADLNVEPSLLAVTETYRSHDSGRFWLPGYNLIEMPLKPGTRRMHRIDEDSHGVGFFVKNEWARTVEPLQNGSKFSDSMWVKMPSDIIFNKLFTSEGGTRSHMTVKTVRELWVGVYYLAPRLAEASLRDCVSEMADIVKRAALSLSLWMI